VQALAS